MPLQIAASIALALSAYAAAGILVGLAFVFRGVSRVDHAAAGAGLGFRLLILPGAAALWPLVLIVWRRTSREGHP